MYLATLGKTPATMADGLEQVIYVPHTTMPGVHSGRVHGLGSTVTLVRPLYDVAPNQIRWKNVDDYSESRSVSCNGKLPSPELSPSSSRYTTVEHGGLNWTRNLWRPPS